MHYHVRQATANDARNSFRLRRMIRQGYTWGVFNDRNEIESFFDETSGRTIYLLRRTEREAQLQLALWQASERDTIEIPPPMPQNMQELRDMQLALRAEMDQLSANFDYWHRIVVHTFAYLQELRDAGRLDDTKLLAELGKALNLEP